MESFSFYLFSVTHLFFWCLCLLPVLCRSTFKWARVGGEGAIKTKAKNPKTDILFGQLCISYMEIWWSFQCIILDHRCLVTGKTDPEKRTQNKYCYLGNFCSLPQVVCKCHFFIGTHHAWLSSFSTEDNFMGSWHSPCCAQQRTPISGTNSCCVIFCNWFEEQERGKEGGRKRNPDCICGTEFIHK